MNERISGGHLVPAPTQALNLEVNLKSYQVAQSYMVKHWIFFQAGGSITIRADLARKKKKKSKEKSHEGSIGHKMERRSFLSENSCYGFMMSSTDSTKNDLSTWFT